jgi:hypothetical protein
MHSVGVSHVMRDPLHTCPNRGYDLSYSVLCIKLRETTVRTVKPVN